MTAGVWYHQDMMKLKWWKMLCSCYQGTICVSLTLRAGRQCHSAGSCSQPATCVLDWRLPLLLQQGSCTSTQEILVFHRATVTSIPTLISLTFLVYYHLISPAAPLWGQTCRRGPWVSADPASVSPWSRSAHDPGRSGSASSSTSERTGPQRPPAEGARSACGLLACTCVRQKITLKLEFCSKTKLLPPTSNDTEPLCTPIV